MHQSWTTKAESWRVSKMGFAIYESASTAADDTGSLSWEGQSHQLRWKRTLPHSHPLEWLNHRSASLQRTVSSDIDLIHEGYRY